MPANSSTTSVLVMEACDSRDGVTGAEKPVKLKKPFFSDCGESGVLKMVERRVAGRAEALLRSPVKPMGVDCVRE